MASETIVFASHSPFSPWLVVGSHHLSRELAAKGYDVCHINPPVTFFHMMQPFHPEYRVRVAASWKPPESIRPRLTSLHPISLLPWQITSSVLSRGNLFMGLSNIGRAFKRYRDLAPVDFLLIDDPRFVGLEKILKPRALIYRATDLYAKIKADKTLVQAERLLLSKCDGVIATSEPVLHHLLSLKPGLPCLLLENGVDHDHFSRPVREPEELKPIPHPRAIYMGAVDFRFDFSVMNFLIGQLPDVHFVVVGPGDNLQKLKTNPKPNLHVLGPKSYDRIPGFLQHSDIALLPLVDSDINSARSPMKLYEYGAAGLPVVATRTRELLRRRESFTHLFVTPDEAKNMIRQTLAGPIDRSRISESCLAHSWSDKAARLEDFIRETAGNKRR